MQSSQTRSQQNSPIKSVLKIRSQTNSIEQESIANDTLNKIREVENIIRQESQNSSIAKKSLRSKGIMQLPTMAMTMNSNNTSVISKNSLFVFSENNKFRKFLYKMIYTKKFDYFILLCIIVNSITLAMYDYKDREGVTNWNTILSWVGQAFAIIFILESIVKILAKGFVGHKNSYLRDPWNVLDFIIVITSVIELVTTFLPKGKTKLNIKAFRNLRVLRPLKSLNAIPSMRRLVSTLLNSMPKLLNVVIFLSFIFLLFGILGTQLFNGLMYNKCRLTEKPVNETYWPVDPDNQRRCSQLKGGGYQCPEGTFCGNPIDYGFNFTLDNNWNDPYIQYGMASFDNFFQTFVAVFQIITRDSWSIVLLNIMDASYRPLAAFYCCLVMIIASFFLMNLFLAVIIEAFKIIQDEEFKEKDKQIQEKEKKFNEQNQEDYQAKSMRLDQENQSVNGGEPSDRGLLQKMKMGNVLKIQPESTTIDDSSNTSSNPLTGLLFGGLNKRQEQTVEIKQDISPIQDVSPRMISDNSSILPQTSRKIKFQHNSRFDTLTSQREKNPQQTEFDEKQEEEKVQKEGSTNSLGMMLFGGLKSSSKIQIGVEGEKIDNGPPQNKMFSAFSKMFAQSATAAEDNENLLVRNIRSKFLEALQLEDRDKREKAKKNFMMQNNFLLHHLQKAIKEKYEQQKKKEYGLNNEAEIVNYLDQNIEKRLMLKKAQSEFIDHNVKISMALELHQEVREKEMRKFIYSKLFNKFQSLLNNKVALQELIKQTQHQFIKDSLEQRSNSLILFKICMKICQSKIFAIAIMIFTMANTIVLAQDKYPIEEYLVQALDKVNLSFYAIFLFEMFIKLLGLGFKQYFRDSYNLFDAIIILISTADVIMTESNLFKIQGSKAILALRAFRLLRIFKLAKSWKQFQKLLKIITQTLKDISTFSVLLLLFIFTYSILGMEWFAFKVKFNDNNEIDFSADSAYPDSNFNSFFDAFLTVFVVLTGDSWSDIYYKHERGVRYLSSFFFLTLVIIGQYILLMLFIAILVENFDDQTFQDSQEQQSIEGGSSTSIRLQLKKLWFCARCLKSKDESQQLKIQNLDQQGGLIQPAEENSKLEKFRSKLKGFVKNNKFDYFILIFILISSVHLILDSPLNDPHGQLAEALRQIDIILTSIFCFEGFLKILAFGFLLNGKESYIRDTWNIIDFFIIIISIASASLPTVDLSVLKILRLFRILRPLRLISKNEGLKISIQALFKAVPNIINVLVIAALFFLIFMIMGVNFFKGLYYYCLDENIVSLTNYDQNPLADKWDCLNLGGEWLHLESSFDNIWDSFKVVFIISQTYSWASAMYEAINSNGTDMIPVQFASQYYSVYFVIFIIIGNFFITYLFVGVVVSTYNREREQLGRGYLLTKEQKKWLQTKLLVIQSKPKYYFKEPLQKWRMAFYKLSKNQYFENTVSIIITLSTLSQTIIWYGQPKSLDKAITYMNYIFTSIFILEALIKLAGFGRRYFLEPWNVFDFIVSWVSLAGIILEETLHVKGVSSTNIVRSFRVIRIFKIFKQQKSLKVIFETFIVTLPALLNVGGLLLLIVYIYAVLCMNLFSEIKFNTYITDNSNYQKIFTSLLTLFRLCTGDNFYELMNDMIVPNMILYECIENPDYFDYASNDMQTVGCGQPLSTILVLTSFGIVVNLIFLNLFIAIILEGYQDTNERNSKMFNSDLRDYFREVWSYFDQDATGYVRLDQFPAFMIKLGLPLGWDDTYFDDIPKQEQFVEKINIPINKEYGTFQFLDVIENLVLFSVINQEIEKHLNDKSIKSDDHEKEIMRDQLMKKLQEAEKEDRELQRKQNEREQRTQKNQEAMSKLMLQFSTPSVQNKIIPQLQKLSTKIDIKNALIKTDRSAIMEVQDSSGSIDSDISQEEDINYSNRKGKGKDDKDIVYTSEKYNNNEITIKEFELEQEDSMIQSEILVNKKISIDEQNKILTFKLEQAMGQIKQKKETYDQNSFDISLPNSRQVSFQIANVDSYEQQQNTIAPRKLPSLPQTERNKSNIFKKRATIIMDNLEQLERDLDQESLSRKVSNKIYDDSEYNSRSYLKENDSQISPK